MRQTAGWVVGLAALGMTLSLIGVEIREFTSFADAVTPQFVGKAMIHVATVIAAFVSGQLVPTMGKKPPA